MALFDLIGRRWALRVVWELEQAGEPLTFRELRTRCSEMSSSVLARRLAELDEAQLIGRGSSGYALTPLGRGLVVALQPLLRWSDEWAAVAVRAR